MKNMKEKSPTDTVEEALHCAFLEWGTDNIVYCNVKRGTGYSKQGRVSYVKRFGMKCLEVLQGCVAMLRADHAITLF